MNMICVDGTEAMQLFADSQSRALSNRLREASAVKVIRLEIEGHPCDITVGFSTIREVGKTVNMASAFVFDGVGTGFFSSAYQLVNGEAEAPAVLNAVIGEAIRGAKANPQFQTLPQRNLPVPQQGTRKAD